MAIDRTPTKLWHPTATSPVTVPAHQVPVWTRPRGEWVTEPIDERPPRAARKAVLRAYALSQGHDVDGLTIAELNDLIDSGDEPVTGTNDDAPEGVEEES